MALVYKFSCEKCKLIFHKKYFLDPDNRIDLPCPICKNILLMEITTI